MLEKLVYGRSNEGKVGELIEQEGNNRVNNSFTMPANTQCTLMELVSIFSSEADKVCANKYLANLIALEALSDYIEGHVSNLKISS